MHLFAIVRGCKKDLDKMVEEMNKQYLPFNHASMGPAHLQVMANPVQLIEFIFPKEHLATIINTLGGEVNPNLQGQATTGFLRRWLRRLRWLVPGLKPIENPNPKQWKIANVPVQNIEIIGLGVKEDGKLPDGTEAI